MVINTNIAAQTSARILGQSNQLLAKSLTRLSSGSRIVSPEDDAAGLAVSMRFDARISRTQAAMHNLGNALSFSQTQDGFLKKISKALDRMSELAILAQDMTKSDSDRGLYNKEFQNLTEYINDVVSKDFNGVSLFSSTAMNVTTDADSGTFPMAGITGSYVVAPTTPSSPAPQSTTARLDELIPGFTSGSLRIDGPGVPGPVTPSFTSSTTLGDFVSTLDSSLRSDGAGYASYDAGSGLLSVTVTPTSNLQYGGGDDVLSGLGLGEVSNFLGHDITITSTLNYTPPSAPSPGAMDISTVSGAASALTSVRSAINQLATDRATVGTNISRLNYTTEQLGTLKINLSAANSRIKDVDVAEESAEFARYHILVQAGTAMLAQANATPNSLLRLLS